MFQPGVHTQKQGLHLLLVAVVTAVATSLVWFAAGYAGYRYLVNEPGGFEVTVEHPEEVGLGEEFLLKVAVGNPSAERARLGSIDFDDLLLGGFEIVSIDPKPDSRQRTAGYLTYYYKRTLQADERFEVELRLRATEAGEWAGDVDACTPLETYTTEYTIITVTDGAEVTEPEEE